MKKQTDSSTWQISLPEKDKILKKKKIVRNTTYITLFHTRYLKVENQGGSLTKPALGLEFRVVLKVSIPTDSHDVHYKCTSMLE